MGKSRLPPQLKKEMCGHIRKRSPLLLRSMVSYCQIKRNIEVYTRVLMMVLNVSWEDHTKNVDLYDTLPQLTEIIRA